MRRHRKIDSVVVDGETRYVGWHSLRKSVYCLTLENRGIIGFLSYSDKRGIYPGMTYAMLDTRIVKDSATCKPLCCRLGMHASDKFIDMLQYHDMFTTSTLTRVEVWGDIDVAHDKIAGRYRRVTSYIAWKEVHRIIEKYVSDLLSTAYAHRKSPCINYINTKMSNIINCGCTHNRYNNLLQELATSKRIKGGKKFHSSMIEQLIINAMEKAD